MPVRLLRSCLATLPAYLRPLAMPAAVRAASPSDIPAKRVKLDPMVSALGAVAGTGALEAMPVASPAPPTTNPTPIPTPTTAPTPTSSTKSQKAKAISAESAPPPPSFPGLTEEQLSVLVEEEMALPREIDKKYAYPLDYTDKLVLAPMVRTGTLPTRLLSLWYGAGLVWSPEIVDRAIIGAERSVDPVTGVITYHKGQGAIFTTHPVEKPFLIFQIGSSNPDLAVQAAQTVAQDVAGIDLNCGCPKSFSTHAGMGAALLSTPDKLLAILRALVRAVPLPVSAKIRLLPTQQATRLLAAKILRTGISNLTVHCRTRNMRPREKAIWERMKDVVELGKRRGLPVTCNGDGEGWGNWKEVKEMTGATSLMLARSAERNPSIFSPTPACTTTVVIPQLLNIAQHTSNAWGNTKFLLMQFKPSPAPIGTLSKAEKRAASEAASRAKSIGDVAGAMGYELGQGAKFIEELGEKLRGRAEWGVWEARKGELERDIEVMREEVARERENAANAGEVGTEQEAQNGVCAAEEEQNGVVNKDASDEAAAVNEAVANVSENKLEAAMAG